MIVYSTIYLMILIMYYKYYYSFIYNWSKFKKVDFYFRIEGASYYLRSLIFEYSVCL
jgi:hypothetical protein